MTISRIKITRAHLKSWRKARVYDGYVKYKQSRKNPDMDMLIAAVLYEVYDTMCSAEQKQAA